MKITRRQLRNLIQESLLLEFDLNPINWFKDKAGKEFDEGKFRLWWEKELLTNIGAIDPRTERRLKQFDIEGKKGERIAQAWKEVGPENFIKAFKELEGKEFNHLMIQLAMTAQGRSDAPPEEIPQIIKDLFDPESELSKRVNKTTGERLSSIWNNWFGDKPEEMDEEGEDESGDEDEDSGEEEEEEDEEQKKVKESRMLRLSRSQLRRIIREEIGRNYHTLDNDPFSWKDEQDISVQIHPHVGTEEWTAEVECLSDPSLSSGEHRFTDEQSAEHWARVTADEILRHTISEQ